MSDGVGAPDVGCSGERAGDGGRGAGRRAVRRVLNAVAVACLLLVVAAWVLPEQRWAPWWPPQVTLIATFMGLGLSTTAPPSHRRSLAVAVFALAAALGWAGLFAAQAGSAGVADALDGVALIGLAVGLLVQWPLVGGPRPSDVRRWWVARRAGVAADPGREGGAGV